MSSIDERVVEMKFNGNQFASGVKGTMSLLDSFKKKLNLDGAKKSLEGLDSAGKKFSLAGMAKGIETISSKFGALSVIGITALANITNKAVNAGLEIAKSFTVEPIMDGFKEYELKMGSIQTILSNTSKAGTTLDDVTASLDELNTYADKTIYNFGDMTKNIGLFTNAGIGIKDATAMIKGFSNEAAASGTSAQGSASAAYQLSQALNTGTIRLMDWKSLSNVGMGNKNMQNGLIELADSMGTLSEKSIKAEEITKDFNGSLEKEWLSAEVMTNYLKIQAGELSDAQMKNLGLSDKQIGAFKKQQTIAQDAATKVRTFTQLMDTLKEAVGSQWAETFDLLLGDFNEATELFTAASETLGGLLESSGAQRNKILNEWDKLGGRTDLIDGVKAGFEALMTVMTPVKEAFQEIFPPTTGAQLANITKVFKNFMESLKMGPENVEKVKRTFKGLFALLDIGIMIVSGVVDMIGKLLGTLMGGTGGFLDITAAIGDWIVGLRDAIKNGEGLSTFFSGLTRILQIPMDMLVRFIEFLGGLASGIGGIKLDGLGEGFKTLGQRMSPLKAIGGAVKGVFSGLGKIFGKLAEVLSPAIRAVADWAKNVGKGIVDAFTNMDFSLALDAINTGLIAGIFLLFKKFLSGGGLVDQIKGMFGGGGGGGVIETIKGVFGQLTDTLSTMQANLKADTLLKIAGAIGILTISVVALSMIDSAKLAKALTGIGVMMGQLLVAMTILGKITGTAGFVKVPIIAGAMILLATAVLILSTAVAVLARLDWNGLAKGLVGVGALLGMIAVTAQVMSGHAGRLITAGIAMTILAVGIRILASSVKTLAELDWEELAKGLVGVGGLLASLALFTKFAAVNKGAMAQGAGLILLGIAMKILASAVGDFAGLSWGELAKGGVALAGVLAIIAGFSAITSGGASLLLTSAALIVISGALLILNQSLQAFAGMTWEEIAKGLVMLAGSLAIIAGAMFLMTGALPGAAALIIVSAALMAMAPVLTTFSEMGWEAIAKGLIMLAGALAIIAGAMVLMSGALPGAAALLVVSAALAILTPVLLGLSALSWGELLIGLVGLAGALTIIGVAGLLLAPVVIPLMGLGIAIALLGVGAALAGIGLLAFATGLTALAVAGAAGVAALVAIVKGLIDLLPYAIKKVGEALIAFADVVVKAAPAFGRAMTAVIMALLQAIRTTAPAVVTTLVGLISLLLNTLKSKVPEFVRSGYDIVIGILNGIAEKTPQLAKSATAVVVSFINGIASNIGDIINAGINLVVQLVNGVANGIRNHQGAMNSAGQNLAGAIISGMVSGIGAGIGSVITAAKGMASRALAAAKSALDINSPSKEFIKVGKSVGEGFAKGIVGSKQEVRAAYHAMNDALKTAKKSASDSAKEEEARLKKLYSARKRNWKAIDKSKKKLKEHQSEYRRTSAAQKALVTKLKDEEKALESLANKRDRVRTKLEEETTAYKDAIKTRDDYRKSLSDQLGDLPDVTKESTMGTYVKDIKKQISETKEFATVIQKLRKLGLNDALYKDLLAKGPEALGFAKNVLEGGSKNVNQLNKLGSELQKTANKLGKSASSALYQAGVDSARGLVLGLKKQEGAITKQMQRLADKMVKALKWRLRIKSPSKVFAKLGGHSGEGLAVGLKQSSALVQRAAEGVGDTAVASMRKTLDDMNLNMSPNLELSPTIRPVLDLTNIARDGSLILPMLDKATIAPNASYSKAASVLANARMAAELDAQTSGSSNMGGGSVTYVQNNTSPKALSAAEIYRQTRNQLSVAKEKMVK